eukprot:CAMPEP_0174289356 /NCGR_PEP_ID=MMETSP0809-20121228/24732_1 /TAXON_ID=73025 ORGANISM="Eutreptiella gymnastica-like, Strain CCMP1594" /NCGR_SAMPLE_ID=MMETSP0809 /ASSEMBLY_ACC=CAM_ASM_000658 /LENGTH=136 /DNA_ID=CAMNT_0015387257 /DNA_START=499 /DNA_END=908 /DNA_ORIENTATION=-
MCMGLCSSGSPAPKIVTVLGPGGQLPRAGPTSTPGQRCHPQAPRPICAKNGTQRSRRNNRNTALKKTLQWDRTTGFEESFLDLENDLEFLNVPTTAALEYFAPTVLADGLAVFFEGSPESWAATYVPARPVEWGNA